MKKELNPMDAYKRYAESLEIPTDLTQRVHNEIAETRTHLKRAFRPVYVLAAVLIVAALSGAAVAITQWQTIIDSRTGEITTQEAPTMPPGYEEAVEKVNRIEAEIAPTVPEGQFAVVQCTLTDSNWIQSGVVGNPWPGPIDSDPNTITDEAFFDKLCESAEINLPKLTSFSGVEFSYGMLYENKIEEHNEPVNTVQYDENTEIVYYLIHGEPEREYSPGTQYRTYSAYYTVGSDKDEICVHLYLYEKGGGGYSGYPDGYQVKEANARGWDYAVSIEGNSSSPIGNTVTVGRELDDAAYYVSLEITGKSSTIEELLDIASRIK